jgi:hypothetical protein
MKCLIVHTTDKGFYGESVEYKKSGSGHYRETTNIAIPQTRPEIAAFARENGYSIEWREIARPPGVVNPASAATG